MSSNKSKNRFSMTDQLGKLLGAMGKKPSKASLSGVLLYLLGAVLSSIAATVPTADSVRVFLKVFLLAR